MSLLFLVFACVFFILATAGVNLPRFQFGWAGLACLALAELLKGAGVLHMG